MTPVHPNTKLRLLNHLSQAEIDLRVAAQFECFRATPAHRTVRAALARLAEAQEWVRTNVKVALPRTKPLLTAREQHQAVNRRMARLAP